MTLRPSEKKEIQRVLNPIRREEAKNWYFDIETFAEGNLDLTEGKESILFTDSKAYSIGWLSHRGIYKNAFGKDCLKSFLRDISRESGEIILWAFNVSFDANYLNRAIAQDPDHFGITEWYVKYTDKGCIIGSEYVWKSNGNVRLRVQLGCAWFWNKTMSLQKWGEVIGKTQKLDQGDKVKYNLDDNFNYYDEKLQWKRLDRQKEVEYLRNDVLLIPEVVEVIKEQQTTFGNLAGIQLADMYTNRGRSIVSNASAAKDSLAGRLGSTFDERYRPLVTRDLYYRMMVGMRGGFTSGSVGKYKVDDDRIKVYDINSMYPSIMKNGVPYGQPIAGRAPSKEGYVQWVEVRGSFCEWKKEWSFFDNKFFGKTFDFCEVVPSFIILEETLELANRVCDHDLEVVRYWHQPLCEKMAEYIDEMYSYRCRLKAEMKNLDENSDEYISKDKEQECTKVCMNSLYGKMGEKYHEFYDEISNINPKIERKSNSPKYPCILSGSYVTAKARLILMTSAISEVSAGNEFLYCDTDSLFLIDKTGKRSFEVDPNKLGAWKLEGEFNRFRYGGKHKKYLLFNTETGKKKMALSGLACKKILEKSWHYDDLQKIFDPDLNIVFVKGKNTVQEVDSDFGIDVFLKTDYHTNPVEVKRPGLKGRWRKVDYVCREPYIRLELPQTEWYAKKG